MAITYEWDITNLVKGIDTNMVIEKIGDITPLINSCSILIVLGMSTAIIEGQLLQKPVISIPVIDYSWGDPEVYSSKSCLVCNIDNLEENIIKLFKTFIDENPDIWTEKLKKEIYEACRTIISHEDAFINLAFEMGPIEGLTADQVKQYIRWIGNRRLIQLGLEPIYQVEKNPLTWLDTMLNAVEHMNFFEGRATEYSKASTKGTWTEAFS